MYRLDRMRKEYESFTKADSYIAGFHWNGLVYGVELDKIPRRYTRVQKESKSNGGGYGLYIDIKAKTIREKLLKKAFYVCTLEELENGTYNKGVMFEKAIYEKFGQEFRGKDSVPFHKGGDIVINGKQVQIKYLHARICYDRTLQKLKKSA